MDSSFINDVRTVAKRKIIYTEHAFDEMNKEEDIITAGEVKEVILEGEIIEDYPEDKRGHSCLMVGYSNKGRPIHVVCSPKAGYLGIITAYVPSKDKWESDFKTRRV